MAIPVFLLTYLPSRGVITYPDRLQLKRIDFISMKMGIVLEGGGQETVMQAAPIGRGSPDETTALIDVHHNGLDAPDT